MRRIPTVLRREFDMLYRLAVQLTSDRSSAKRLLQEAVLSSYRSCTGAASHSGIMRLASPQPQACAMK